MGFRGQEFAFKSPAAAVAGLIARLAGDATPARTTRASEVVALGAARGRILAQPVPCDRDSPAFDHAAMDGYAVRAADVHAAADRLRKRGETKISLDVVGESRIGCEPPSLPSLSPETAPHAAAIRIATGAPIPTGSHGADAIIKREDVIEHADEAVESVIGVRAVTLTIDAAERVTVGTHIRRRGENSETGDVALAMGEVLSAASLGALAAVGCVTPYVFARLRVALVTTGDELVAAHETPGPFQIRNSNAAAAAAVLTPSPWIELVHSSHLPDDGDLAAVLRGVLESPTAAEAVILTGGVSMGHRDPVRAAVEGVGAEVIFHGLPQRPGKPMLAAVLGIPRRAAVPIFGLPGNPVSAMVTCTRVALPVLAACAGATRTPTTLLPRLLELAGDDGNRIGLWWHRPALLRMRDSGRTLADLVDTRGSGDVISASRSDGFVELPPAKETPTGTEPVPLVPFYPWPT